MYQDIEFIEQDSLDDNYEFHGKAVLRWGKNNSEIKVVFETGLKEIRACEFLDYILDYCGMVKGDAGVAQGVISCTMMDMLVSKNDCDSVCDYMKKRTKQYCDSCQCIYADKFSFADIDTESVHEYRKRKIPWAFVRSCDIGSPGDVIILKSLENESGVELTITEDLYIMIGCRGEVYNISSDKFENAYSETDKELDIFEQMLDFLPEIEFKSDGRFVSIDDKAKLCYPKPGSNIYAVELDRRTKVFYGDNEDYFLGKEGDYMAIRKDDLHDVYIIKKNIFHQTYEPV